MYGYSITFEQDGSYLLGSLPDWPECNPVGATREDVIRDAERSIEEMAIARIEDGEYVPPPRIVEAGDSVKLSFRVWLKLGLYAIMKLRGVRQTELARRMGVDPKAVQRLLDLNHSSRLEALEAAFEALGVFPEVRMKVSEAASQDMRRQVPGADTSEWIIT